MVPLSVAQGGPQVQIGFVDGAIRVVLPHSTGVVLVEIVNAVCIAQIQARYKVPIVLIHERHPIPDLRELGQQLSRMRAG